MLSPRPITPPATRFHATARRPTLALVLAGLLSHCARSVGPATDANTTVDQAPPTDEHWDLPLVDVRVIPLPTCARGCRVDLRTGTSTCSDPIQTELVTAPPNATALLRVDMSGWRELEVTVDVCDPIEYVLHVADSPSCNGWGGDGADFEHDGEFQIQNDVASAFASDLGDREGLLQVPGFLPTTGCSQRTIRFADRRIYAAAPLFDLTHDTTLRVNPPSDSEGVPDALWYIALNRTYGTADRGGSGTRWAQFCLR